MLLELAIGDAYGAGFEYAPKDKIQQSPHLTRYFSHESGNIPAGAYTDDTQMSLAIAELMLSNDPWTPETVAKHFVSVFKRDPRPGYASGFYRFLQLVEDEKEFLASIKPNSHKSGAAMRAVPIGLYSSVKEVIDKSSLQAAVTHNTLLGINAAVAVSVMSHFFTHRLGRKDQLVDFLMAHINGHWDKPWPGGSVGSLGMSAVKAALSAVLEGNSLTEVLLKSVQFGGDVDTVATIALGVASQSEDIHQDLPDVLIQGLERGPFGYDYLVDIDARLEAWRKKSV